jgi:hypothetical protein
MPGTATDAIARTRMQATLLLDRSGFQYVQKESMAKLNLLERGGCVEDGGAVWVEYGWVSRTIIVALEMDPVAL